MLQMWRVVWVRCLKTSKVHRSSQTTTSVRTLEGEAPLAYFCTSAYTYKQQDPAVKQQEQQDIQVQEHDVYVQQIPGLLQDAIITNSLTSAYKGLSMLSDWVSSKKLDFKKDVESDEHFDKLIGVIDRGVTRSSPAALLSALRNLMTLGVDSHSHVVQSIELQLQWNLRKMSFPLLLSVMALQAEHQDTDLQKKVFKDCIESIQRRWVEVRAASELETLYSHHDHFSPEFLGQLDDRTTELANSMTYAELAKVLCVLGVIKRRATPVIRSLAFHMAKQSDRVSPKQLGNVLFAMNSLSFPDPVLLEKIAGDLIPQLEQVEKPKLVGTILFCMGQMRWRHKQLLEALSEWTEKNASACPLASLSALTMTLAIVGYEPSNSHALFSVITSRLTQTSLTKKTNWLDVVWALSVLGKVTNEHIASVLDPSFVSDVTRVEQHLSLGVRLKLLNVNAVSQLILPSYRGPQLNLSDFKDVIVTTGRDDLKFSKQVLMMLHNLLPPPKYIHQCIQMSTGVYVDAQFATDKNAKPLPVQDYSSVFSSKLSEVGTEESTVSKELPEGATKLALMVWNYRDYTVGDRELTGINKLAVELLKKQGYKVVQIPFYEYDMKGKTLKTVQYLERKIKETLCVY